jgi:hypothetical protein
MLFPSVKNPANSCALLLRASVACFSATDRLRFLPGFAAVNHALEFLDLVAEQGGFIT